VSQHASPPTSRRTATVPPTIRDRAGELVPFDRGRITAAVLAAMREVGRVDPARAEEATDLVLNSLPAGVTPTVEQVQDQVERSLMRLGLEDVARAYIAYRRRRAELREAKRLLGVRDELKLPLNSVVVLRDRYLLHDQRRQVVESTGEMMERVARHIAAAEDVFAPGSSSQWAETFSQALRGLEFLPNSPTLMNAGTGLGLLSGCFVLPVEDSLESIFITLRDMALIHQAGGGTGFSFSHLRPRGDLVSSTQGTASGPVSFMRIFDTTTEVIKQGGRRRGANMGVLSVSHPDIEEFVTAKSQPGAFENFNLSVAVSDAFLHAVQRGELHHLVNPRNGETVRELPARELFDLICEQAHRTGDPGLLFIDRINRDHVLPRQGRIEATNPCGEVPLLPYESCNLGSVNLPRLLDHGRLDWDRLRAVVRLLTRFLDDVIEVNRYPRPEIREATLASRKIGIGVMGLAELLARLGIPYDSSQAIRLGARIAREIREAAQLASAELAKERGPFPLFEESTLAARGSPPLRNAQLLSIAPTGTISLIAGTTAGIEPMFAVAYVRNVLGTHLVELNPHFDRLTRERGFYSDQLAAEIARTGSVRDHPQVPEDVRRAFVTALEIEPSWHLRMQAAFQRSTDGAVSKTVNLPTSATVEDVRSIYLAAWRAGLKGITVYRYGSRPAQVLTFLSDTPAGPAPPLGADLEYAGGCAGRLCDV
jgi:ribonucleoside-diphosphate reductase alpha chain